MITILEWLKKNNVRKSAVQANRAVVAISVTQDQNPDTMIVDESTKEKIYLKKTTDLNLSIDPDVTRTFVMSKPQWEKITTKNIFASKLRQEK